MKKKQQQQQQQQPVLPKLLTRSNSKKWKTKTFVFLLVGFCFSTFLLMEAQYSRISVGGGSGGGGASSFVFPGLFVQKPKIAFLFLARNRLPLDLVWDEFFQSESENRFSIYVHSRPGFLLNRLTTRSRYFLDRQVNNSIQIYWGEASMIQAEIILLQHALMDPSNERFAFLSDSCIPLYNFSYTYDYIMSASTSFDSFADTKVGRYKPKMDPVIRVHHWRKGSQWVILTRKHAEIIVRDKTVFPMFQQHCQRKSLPEFWRDRPVRELI